MRDEIKKHLWDTRQALRNILEYASGKTLGDYRSSRMIRGAVEREFQIVGEGLARLHRADAQLASRIPHYRQIVEFRNVIVHEYDQISDEEVWSIVEDDVEPLLKTVESLLEEET